MPTTMQQIIDSARETALNDAKKVRWKDAELLTHGHNFLRLLLARRPEYFLGQLAAPAVTPAIGENFPVDERAIPACRDYMIGMAHGKDIEEAIAQKALTFLELSAGEA
jgi:hypothetical protein